LVGGAAIFAAIYAKKSTDVAEKALNQSINQKKDEQ